MKLYNYPANRKKYFALNIHQRINARQHRNSLNINHLYPTTLSNVVSGYMFAEDMEEGARPNTGLYHKLGKRHSMYPKDSRHNYSHRNPLHSETRIKPVTGTPPPDGSQPLPPEGL